MDLARGQSLEAALVRDATIGLVLLYAPIPALRMNARAQP